jgi:cold shock CspA family protein
MERGTIESWSLGSGQWYGDIRADNGDRVLLFYWSVVRGFNQPRIGRRVEFSRMVGLKGLERNIASLAVPVLSETDSN